MVQGFKDWNLTSELRGVNVSILVIGYGRKGQVRALLGVS